MSGGSYQYVYARVEEAADPLVRRTPEPNATERIYDRERGLLSAAESAPIVARIVESRRWFAAHLRLVAKALHDVERVDSDDYGPGDELAAIDAVRDHASLTVGLIDEPEEEDAPIPVESIEVLP